MDRRGEADRVVGTDQIIVDRPRATDDLAVPMPGQRDRAVEGPVAADRHQGVDTVLSQQVGRLLLTGFGAKLVASAAVQYGSATLGEV